jgi:NTE family protein
MKIGLALGGGGVRGFAHVLVLKTLDEMGLQPARIAGTSMGAIVGALYASGISGQELLKRMHEFSVMKNDSWQDIYNKRDKLLEWLDVFSLESARGGILKPEGFFERLMGEIKCTTFEELEIPFAAIAADYWSAEEVVFNQGELRPAIQASMAVPGIFAPVSYQDRVLIDGGVVNLVPYDHLKPHCDLTIAVDVGGTRYPDETPVPNMLESLLGTIDIMQEAMLADKLEDDPPDIYIRPEIKDVKMMDFMAIEEVLDQAQPAIDELADKLRRLHK